MAPELSAGIPAYNEERRISAAIRSLLEQELPAGWKWREILVVASGCTDRTAEVARLADPRVSVITQPHRMGKSAALSVIFEEARGDALALLNADARALPCSLERLISALPSLSNTPSVVMARCIVPARGGGPLDRAVELLWEIHHQLYLMASRTGQMVGVSDELLLLGRPFPSNLHAGVINDGGFIGGSIRNSGGTVLYETAAEVELRTPRSIRDLVRQRRRIRYGHARNARELGVPPVTWGSLARRDPLAAMAVLRRSSQAAHPGAGGWSCLMFAEFVASFQSGTDALLGRVDHVRWPPASDSASPAPNGEEGS